MKRTIIFLITISFMSILNAQIVVTQNNVKDQHIFGTVFTEFVDTTTRNINIGKLGGGNYWDFSSAGLTAHITYDQEVVDPSTTPFTSTFPDADWAIHVQEELQGTKGDLWWYGGFPIAKAVSYGYGSQTESNFGTIQGILTSSPEELGGIFPMTIGSVWAYVGVETYTLKTGIIPVATAAAVTVGNIIDAHGTLKLPNGKEVDALRLRELRKRIIQIAPGVTEEFNEIVYTFFSKTGEEVSISVEDTTQASTGVVTIHGAMWYDGSTTDIKIDEVIPETYSLKQNYPNPFNPSTTVEYSVSEPSQIKITVYNILGSEIATLVNEYKSSGTYREIFNAKNLTSGNYIIRLQAGNYSEVKKMTLIK